MDNEQNILFGVLAAKHGFITLDQLAQACSTWAKQKAMPVPELLVSYGWLSPEDRRKVQDYFDGVLAEHKGSTRQALATMSDLNTRDVIRETEDPHLRDTINNLPAGEGHVKVVEIGRSDRSSRYTRTRVHGEGALGKVWLARDQDLNRDVALKEIRSQYTNHEEATARFFREAQVTGQLEHPNIVPVYELERGPEGEEPFYTMRFVHGKTLEEVIVDYHRRRKQGDTDEVDLSLLLQHFAAICNAIAYAHSRGVIHRDLKPENVVVGDYGEVIVLDWGLAKSIGQQEDTAPQGEVKLSEAVGAYATQTGHVLGTPAFMAPEQAAGQLDQIDSRTDVYGLGAILFEILTGKPPHRGTSTKELLHKIAQGPTPRVQEVESSVPGALAAICSKAMAKSQKDRYRSAADLAVDIQRWLADEPVAIYPEPISTRLTRWMRRHRTLVTSTTGTVLVALVGLVAGMVLLSAANERERTAKQQAVENFEEAESQRGRAQENFTLARGAVDDYFTEVSEDVLLKAPGMKPLRRELLSLARGYYENFVAEYRQDPDLKQEVAAAQYRQGLIVGELESPAAGLVLFNQAKTVQKLLVDEDQEDLSRLYDLGNTWNAIGKSHHELRQLDKALEAYQQAFEIREKLAKAEPNNTEYARRLANSWMNIGIIAKDQGDFDEAQENYLLAQEIRRQALPGAEDDIAKHLQRDLGMNYYNMAVVDIVRVQVESAEENLRQAIDAFESLLEEEPNDLNTQFRLALCYRLLGDTLRNAQDWSAAAQFYDRAQQKLEVLMVRNPSVLDYAAKLASVHMNIGYMKLLQLENGAAVAELGTAIDLLRPVVEGDESTPEHRHDLGAALATRGQGLAALDQTAAAGEDLREAREIFEALVETHPDNTDYRARLEATVQLIEQLNGE